TPARYPARPADLHRRPYHQSGNRRGSAEGVSGVGNRRGQRARHPRAAEHLVLLRPAAHAGAGRFPDSRRRLARIDPERGQRRARPGRGTARCSARLARRHSGCEPRDRPPAQRDFAGAWPFPLTAPVCQLRREPHPAAQYLQDALHAQRSLDVTYRGGPGLRCGLGVLDRQVGARLTATVVLVTLLLTPAASGSAAAPGDCRTYTRGSEALPAHVGGGFAHSLDGGIVRCLEAGAPGSGGATALYFGGGGVTQHGTVCMSPRHGLTLTGNGAAARLERYDRSESLAMALADPH